MSTIKEYGGLLHIILSVILGIFAGIISWNMIEPESFLGFIMFLFFWGIFATAGSIIAGVIIAIFE